jgi:hypothetical protein
MLAAVSLGIIAVTLNWFDLATPSRSAARSSRQGQGR